MKKNLLTLISVISSSYLFAQVGINTEVPKATLDVVSTPTDLTKIDGFIAPRLEGSELQSKNSLYTSEQTGTIIYAKSASPEAGTSGDKTINVDQAGYYYFDGTVWIKVGNGTAIEPWLVQNTSTKAENNMDNIYQKGKVAVGFESTDAVSDKQFEVKGDIKSEFVDADNYIYNFETAKPTSLDPNTKEILMSVSNDENLAAATHNTMLGLNKNNLMFYTKDATTSNQKVATVIASNLTDGGFAGVSTVATSENKYAFLGGLTWTDTVEGAIETRQEVEGNNIEINLRVRPKTGITFGHQGAADYGTYTFPKNAPQEGQILAGSAKTSGSTTGRQLEWIDIQDAVILKSSGGNCFKIAVDDAGTLATVPASCL